MGLTQYEKSCKVLEKSILKKYLFLLSGKFFVLKLYERFQMPEVDPLY